MSYDVGEQDKDPIALYHRDISTWLLYFIGFWSGQVKEKRFWKRKKLCTHVAGITYQSAKPRLCCSNENSQILKAYGPWSLSLLILVSFRLAMLLPRRHSKMQKADQPPAGAVTVVRRAEKKSWRASWKCQWHYVRRPKNTSRFGDSLGLTAYSDDFYYGERIWSKINKGKTAWGKVWRQPGAKLPGLLSPRRHIGCA